jgi:hypothetical protein
MSLTWVDGVAGDTVPADDRGLNYADGAFETLSCDEGRIWHEDLHRSRLIRALTALQVVGAADLGAHLFEEAGQCLKTARTHWHRSLDGDQGLRTSGVHTAKGISATVYSARLSRPRFLTISIAMRYRCDSLGGSATVCGFKASGPNGAGDGRRRGGKRGLG